MSGAESPPQTDIVLNPALDRRALARSFAKTGRIQIRDFMTPHYAENMHEVFLRHVPWSLAYNRGRDNIRLTPEQLAAMPQAKRAKLNQEIMLRARSEYQFLYHTFQIVSAYQSGEYAGHPFMGLVEYINGEEFLDFVRQVTDMPGLVKADAQATLYAPGDFLTLHEDTGKKEEGWRLAYVMSFTKGWRADWGGLLHFYSEDKDRVIDTFVPRFNALNIFRVPTPHAVSFVSPFAGTGRYSITGWFRDR